MERLVRSLLALARLEVDPRSDLSETVNLSELVTDELRRRPIRAGVAVRSDVTAGVHAIIADAQARQVVTNVVDNAERHANGQVVVTVRSDDDTESASLIVADDGPGVAPGEREVVFGRFTRLDESRNDSSGGAGLGLAIVRDIVVRNHGTVAFTDGAVGARVVVNLRSSSQGATVVSPP